MRITAQVLAVTDYGGDEEDVIGCFDGIDEAKEIAPSLAGEFGPITLCQIRIVETVEVVS